MNCFTFSRITGPCKQLGQLHSFIFFFFIYNCLNLKLSLKKRFAARRLHPAKLRDEKYPPFLEKTDFRSSFLTLAIISKIWSLHHYLKLLQNRTDFPHANGILSQVIESVKNNILNIFQKFEFHSPDNMFFFFVSSFISYLIIFVRYCMRSFLLL